MNAKDEAHFDKILDDLARVGISNSGSFITSSANSKFAQTSPQTRSVFAPKTATAEMYGILYVKKDI